MSKGNGEIATKRLKHLKHIKKRTHAHTITTTITISWKHVIIMFFTELAYIQQYDMYKFQQVYRHAF